MSLEIIYGNVGSGKTTQCFNMINKILENESSNIIYIVPEQFSLLTEQKISNAFGSRMSERIDVLSFERMAQRVFSTVGPVCAQYIDETGKLMFLERTLIKLENKLTVFSNVSKIDDFKNVILNIIDELKICNIMPQDLKTAADEISKTDLKFKLLDIALIYEEYCKQLGSTFADSKDDTMLLCDKIIKHNLFCNTYIFLDAFISFSPAQYCVIKELMLRCKNITLTLTTNSLEPSENIDIFQIAKKTATRFFEIAIDNKIEILPNIYCNKCRKFQNNHELLHIEDNYFKYPAKQYENKTENITIFTANNYYGEIENIAMQIIRLCRDENYRFRDIAVITRNLDIYAPLIRNIFNEYNILYFMDESFCALKHPLSQAILSVFDVVIHNFNYDSLFKWFKSDYCGLEKCDVYLLENYILAVGNTQKMWTNDNDWTFLSSFTQQELNKINIIKNNARLPIINFISNFSGRKKTIDIATAFTQFLDEVNISKIVLEKAVYLNNIGKIQQSNAVKQVYNYMIDTIDQMVLILGGEFITFEKFYAILKSGLSGFEIGQRPATVDEVQVSTVERFIQQDIKCVFIIGVNEGVFPAVFNNEGVLSDYDRDALNNIGLEIGDSTLVKQTMENYVIYRAITSPKDKLYVSFSTADNEGKGLNCSSVINRIKNIFPNVMQHDNIYTHDDIMQYVEGKTPTFGKVIENMGNDLWKQVEMWYKQNEPLKYNNAINALNYTNMPQKLTSDMINILYGNVPYASVSKAEQFNRCQFSYFLKYGLRVNPRKEYKIEPADAGSFMHEIIEKFSLFAKEFGWSEIDKTLCTRKTKEITEETLLNYLGDIYRTSARFIHLSKKIEKIMSTTIWNITEFYKNSSFVPLGYEVEFSDNGDFPPIELELDNGKTVKLVGKVDRADVYRTDSGNFVSIVDYKSSSKDIDFSEVLCGIQIQLPVYIDAVCKALTKNEGITSIPAAILYYKIDSPVINANRDISQEEVWLQIQKALKMRGLTLENENITSGIGSMYMVKSAATGKQIDRLCSTAYKQLKKAMNGVVDGNININPVRVGNKTSCDYCPYGSICMFDASFDNKYRNIRKLNREEFFEHVGDMDT